jgi:RNA polymerase sigma-70 factor (ECF subfamily)
VTRRARKGDGADPLDRPEERFDRLFREHGRDLLGYALRRATDAEDAADVVAETFLVAWRRIEEVPPGAQARPWLFGVARHTLANSARGARRRGRLSERLREDLMTQLPAHSEKTPVDTALIEALGRLGEDDREVLRLAAWEQLDSGELALALGVSPVTARGRLHRARKRLRRELEKGPNSTRSAPVKALGMEKA